MDMTIGLTKTDERRLESLVEVIDLAKSRSVKDALAIGKALSEAKEILAKPGCKGEFSSWVRDRCNFSRTTAYSYIELSEIWGNCKAAEQFDLGALRALMGKDAAREEAIALAKKGHYITTDRANEIIHGPEPEPEPVVEYRISDNSAPPPYQEAHPHPARYDLPDEVDIDDESDADGEADDEPAPVAVTDPPRIRQPDPAIAQRITELADLMKEHCAALLDGEKDEVCNGVAVVMQDFYEFVVKR